MAVPKRKTSQSRKGMRRSHLGAQMASTTVIRCSRCNNFVERHTICGECGYYRGKPVVAVNEGI